MKQRFNRTILMRKAWELAKEQFANHCVHHLGLDDPAFRWLMLLSPADRLSFVASSRMRERIQPRHDQRYFFGVALRAVWDMRKTGLFFLLYPSCG